MSEKMKTFQQYAFKKAR